MLIGSYGRRTDSGFVEAACQTVTSQRLHVQTRKRASDRRSFSFVRNISGVRIKLLEAFRYR